VNYFTITGGNAVSYWIDNLQVTQAITTATTINNAETSTTGTSTSVTPLTVNGTLAVALGVNEVVEVFRNGVSIGNATVTGTTWTIVDSTLNTVQVDLYEAHVKNSSTSALVTDSNNYVINDSNPTVSGVVISATGASGTLLNAGDVVTVTTTYSETVTGQPTTAPTLTIGTETGITLTAGTTTGNTRTWTYTITDTGTTDTGSISVVGNLVAGLSDGTGNAATGSTPAATGSFVADTTAPTVVITDNTAGTANGDVTFTFTFSEAVTGFDASDINVSSGGTKGTFTQVDSSHYTLQVTPVLGAGNYTVDVGVGSYTDSAGNSGAAAAQATQAYSNIPSTISLGTGMGNLIDPVTEQGGTYYYWDRSGDGSSANTGSQNGGLDYTSMPTLISLFSHTLTDVAGAPAGTVIDETHHYAWINGVHLSLPTLGAPVPGNGVYMPGTVANTTYSDLLGIWDSQNGSGTTNDASGTPGTVSNGTPSGWQPSGYWSATPDVTGPGHAYVNLSNGNYVSGRDIDNLGYVALQVVL
jgi:hypothetical protein